jgi:hypothetical protein
VSGGAETHPESGVPSSTFASARIAGERAMASSPLLSRPSVAENRPALGLDAIRMSGIHPEQPKNLRMEGPLWRSSVTHLNDHRGEGFRMPSGVGKPPKHEPAGLR